MIIWKYKDEIIILLMAFSLVCGFIFHKQITKHLAPLIFEKEFQMEFCESLRGYPCTGNNYLH